MNALVDTSVWSLAYRRKSSDLSPAETEVTERLAELIRARNARIIGPIRQELLSGIKTEAQFERLRLMLGAFLDEELSTTDFEEAARSFNFCRARGLDVTHVDILICTAALRRGMAVFTMDAHLKRCCQKLNVPII